MNVMRKINTAQINGKLADVLEGKAVQTVTCLISFDKPSQCAK